MSAEEARPWWASSDPDVADLDRDEDPVETVRQARRGGSDGGEPEPGGARPQGDDPDEPLTGHGDGHDQDGPVGRTGDHEPCGVCPLCAGWRALTESHPEAAEHLAAAGHHLGELRPEVADHLAAAGRHLAAALRTLLEPPEETADPDAPFERIDVVDDGPEPGR